MTDTGEKRKRAITPSVDEHSSQRRKSDDSDISEVSNVSNDSRFSPLTTITTMDSQVSPKGHVAEGHIDGGERAGRDISYYYAGLPGRPKLLARSSNEPWVRPLVKIAPGPATPFSHQYARKEVHPTLGHPLREKLDGGLRTSIHEILSTMRPAETISVDFVRIGYEEVVRDNPVIIWVTVEKDKVGHTEAKRIADAIKLECLK